MDGRRRGCFRCFSCFFLLFQHLELVDIVMVAALTTVASLAVLASIASATPLESRAVKNVLPSYISSNLGPYSPYAAVAAYPSIPAGCTLEQANILQRHGQRYPTASAGKKIAASIAKLKSATSLSPELAFVSSYVYDLGADDLTPTGAAEMHAAGQTAYSRYAALYPPFTRTDSSQRVIDSAGNWTQGFYLRRRVQYPPQALIINDAAGSNDTLDDNNCNAAPDLSSYENSWRDTFLANATARLNAGAPGAKLTATDSLQLMSQCGFASEYHGTLDPFCTLFSEEEWAGFEYYYDLDKFYGTGYGQPLGAVQGVGYVSELISRLTGNRYWHQHDQTQVNHTLDNNPATFPLDYNLFFDASHDNEITAILAAIGLKKDSTPLSASGPAAGQVWVTSQIVPFAGHLVTERLKCPAGTYVRFLINDQLQIPTFCPGYDSTTGLCLLSSFTNSQTYVRANGNGDYLKCGYGTSD